MQTFPAVEKNLTALGLPAGRATVEVPLLFRGPTSKAEEVRAPPCRRAATKDADHLPTRALALQAGGVKTRLSMPLQAGAAATASPRRSRRVSGSRPAATFARGTLGPGGASPHLLL
mmetsp:Transcript_10955/g.33852  ORF Transcript_10955/g.33852 Transcript_10955/m.33852 type:complete len:117 (+) Transcript_10955:864-1214(+)